MSTTHCQRKAKEGVMDIPYIENRLDAIEARIDDLCGLLGELLERIDRGRTIGESLAEIDTYDGE